MATQSMSALFFKIFRCWWKEHGPEDVHTRLERIDNKVFEVTKCIYCEKVFRQQPYRRAMRLKVEILEDIDELSNMQPGR